MFLRLFTYILGILLTSIGAMFILIYSSIFFSGNGFFSSIFYFFSKLEIYLLPIGLIVLVFATFFDVKWYKINRLRKQYKKAARNHYKENIKNDK